MKRVFPVFALLMLVGGTTSSANAALMPPLTVDGREWLQPLDFSGSTWNQVASACDPGSGICTGSLLGDSLAGWRWASTNDVASLLNFFLIESNASELLRPWSPPGSGPPWNPDNRLANGAAGGFFGAGFNPTSSYYAQYESWQQTIGTTRTLGKNGEAEVAGVYALSSYGYTSDQAIAGAFTAPMDSISTFGHWFYRGPVAVIPEPATIWLVALLLVGVRLGRHCVMEKGAKYRA